MKSARKFVSSLIALAITTACFGQSTPSVPDQFATPPTTSDQPVNNTATFSPILVLKVDVTEGDDIGISGIVNNMMLHDPTAKTDVALTSINRKGMTYTIAASGPNMMEHLRKRYATEIATASNGRTDLVLVPLLHETSTTSSTASASPPLPAASTPAAPPSGA